MTDYCGEFGNEKIFSHIGALSLERWREILSSWLRHLLKNVSSTLFTWLGQPWSCLFQKLKNALKGQRLADIPDIQHNVTLLLWGIPENNFQDSFGRWYYHFMKWIASQGEYFKGDSSHYLTDKQILLLQSIFGN